MRMRTNEMSSELARWTITRVVTSAQVIARMFQARMLISTLITKPCSVTLTLLVLAHGHGRQSKVA